MGQDGAKQVWEFPTPVPPYLFIYLLRDENIHK